MNEKLKELQKLSGLQAYYDQQQSDIEKFAELIVRECVSIINHELYCDNSPLADKLIKHFGVE